MKKTLLMGLLGAVIGVGASLVSTTASAAEDLLAPCCSFCDARYEACLSGCTTPACEVACENTWDGCFGVCRFEC
ncbi:hypothetical protein [Myxococcus qinghaiensis]|uniref:hypothetical protein n=1 Tax=Myxococcus qinghaiensis TaxID=2906758 RepID=UPI0020A7DF3B|nr:hypothetical protein [Myxococcus qinghaiensis]MCP3168358.1 hypothetical protein [Myxococcus qinghaiensis]